MANKTAAQRSNRPTGAAAPLRPADARERILDAAEWIFAHQGPQALSMRTITARARMNVAGVHYYFGSKEGLILELVRRRFEPINACRIALLEEAIESTSPRPPALEAIVDAFLEPMLRVGESVAPAHAETVRRFIGRVGFLPPEVSEQVFNELFEPLARRFHQAIQEALPNLGPSEIFWRMHFSVGPLLRVLVQGDTLPRMSRGLCPIEPIATVQRRLRDYICAGLRAPSSAAASSESPEKPASNTGRAV